jgi:hypothetical protein
MSAEKKHFLAKETSGLPYLSGVSKEIAHEASQIRDEILETVFDRFIKPDDATTDVSATSRWKRARKLWKALITERRASFFIDLKASKYIDWISTGAATVLPCTTEEVENRDKTLPGLQGRKEAVLLAREIRATLLKYSDELEQKMLERAVQAEKRQKLERIREIIREVTDAEWFIKRQPKDFSLYEKLVSSWVRQ